MFCKLLVHHYLITYKWLTTECYYKVLIIFCLIEPLFFLSIIFYPSLFSIYRSFYPSFYRSFHILFFLSSLYHSIYRFSIYRSFYPLFHSFYPTFPSIHCYIVLSVHHSFYLSFFPSIVLSFHHSIIILSFFLEFFSIYPIQYPLFFHPSLHCSF